MTEEEKKSNPNGHISPQLCEAYRKTLTTEIKGMEETFTAKIDGVKNTIIVGLTISTMVISIVMWLLRGGT